MNLTEREAAYVASSIVLIDGAIARYQATLQSYAPPMKDGLDDWFKQFKQDIVETIKNLRTHRARLQSVLAQHHRTQRARTAALH